MHPPRPLLFLLVFLAGCAPDAARRGATVLFASGADLQSINPLFTVHPLAKQVQRYVLLTTLVRRDSAMRIEPYVARHWTWSADARRLTLTLFAGLRWHDGAPTTARDAAWTLERARDPGTGYPRQADLRDLVLVRATDDTTLELTYRAAQTGMPDVLTDLAILPAHLFADLPPEALRQAAWNEHPVGNGPFRFVLHEANRRWVFEKNPDYPLALGGPPLLERLVIAVVDEPMTKLAALVSGELDVAGIQPAHAEYVRRDPALRAVDYPLLFSTAIVFNTRRQTFADVRSRRGVARALDRAALVAGVVYGFGTPADGPVPPELHLPVLPARTTATSATVPARFELLTVGSGEAALEQMIQAQLAAHGSVVTIRQLELSAFLDRVYGPRKEFDAALLGVPGDPGLGHLVTVAEMSGLRLPPDADSLVQFFSDSLPATFVYHARGLQGMSRRLQGVAFGLRGELATVTQWSVTP